MRLPRYRVWAGMALWLGLTAADAYLAATQPWWQAGNDGPAGALSLLGFVAAFAWSWRSP
jgi:hypothetical protein